MSTITWKNAVSDVFSNAAAWNGGVVPGSGDDAVLGTLSGGAYTVSAAGQAVNSLQLASNATLLVSANQTFQMTNGTGAGVDAGVINVANNDSLYVGGTMDITNTSASGGL